MARAKSISIITLGVDDLEQSIRFYEALGWECSPESDPKICTYMLADNIVLGLVPYDFLGHDAQMEVTPKAQYRGFTLAINGSSAEEVDELFATAVKAGRNHSGRTGEDVTGTQDIFWIWMDIHGKLPMPRS